MPSCSWLLAPRSQVGPNEPDSKTCAFLRGRPVRTCLVQRRFRWARGWADFIAKKAQLLVGAWRDADFAIIAITTKKPRQSAVPRTKLVQFVGVAGAGSGAVPERPSPFLLYRRGVRARAPREFGGAARTHKSSTRPDFITIIRCGWFCTVGPPRKHSPCC